MQSRTLKLALLSSLLCLGCKGTIFEPLEPSGFGPDGPNPNGPNPSGPNPDAGPGAPLPITPAPAPRVARLTHLQWENTVRDLLRLDPSAPIDTSGLRADPAQSGFLFDNNADALEVDEVLWAAYQRTAVSLAEYVATDAGRLARILPPDPGDETQRAVTFIETFGLRAHRRPLSPEDRDAYLAIYEAGRTLYADDGAFAGGMRLLLEAFLQSPYLLYRTEISTEVRGDLIPLDGYEVASRLSYFLLATMPDDELLTAAGASRLGTLDEVRLEADRLLADPRAERVVARFHEVLLHVDKFDGISPAEVAFPNVSPELSDHARRENQLFLEAIFREDGTLSELLTSRETFVNDELAAIYGLSGTFGAEFQRVTLDERRRGIFTQVGFLASNATSFNPDPIHRGVFLTSRIACNPLGAPPAEIPPLPPPDGRTNREVVADHTEREGTICASCHTTLINPFGFPFENYDAVGAWRDEDNGFPVDATASPFIGTMNVPVRNAVELAEALAASKKVHECYGKHWLEYAFGRKERREDRGLIADLGTRSLDGGSLRGLLAALVASPAFLNRSMEELP